SSAIRDTEPQLPHLPLAAVISRPYSSSSGPPIAFPSRASMSPSSRCDLRIRGPGARAPPGRTAAFFADVDDRLLAVAGAAAVHIEDRGRLDHVAQLGVAVASGVEIRALLGEDLAYGGKPRPTVLPGRRLDRVAEQVHQRRVAPELRRGGALALLGSRAGGCRVTVAAGGILEGQVLRVDELVARRHERLWRLALAEPVDGETGLAQPRRQPGEVAVA